MATLQEFLGDLRRLLERERPDVRAEIVRIAGVLNLRGCRSVGFLPAADDVGVPAIALQAGLALAQLTGSPTAVIDGQGTWQGPLKLDAPVKDGSIFATLWLTEKLALLTPRAYSTSGMLIELQSFLREEARAMHHVIVDMTGFDHTGDHLEVMAMLDGVVVVARAGLTTSRQLDRSMRDVPASQNLGVLLLGI